ncbi:MAG: radical SAM protein [bacterium]|nr:radical SAM protein [bacterium]
MQKDNLVVNIRANPCVNRCRHCWTEGTPKRDRMKSGEVKRILEALSDARNITANCLFFLFDEPTFRDDFLEILEYAAKLGLIEGDFWFPSNGFGLARGDEKYWERLKTVGVEYLSFTFYGLNEVHDNFARRHGAFEDLTTAMRKADEYGIDYVGAAILRSNDEGDVLGTVEHLTEITKGAKIGWFMFMDEGRGSGLTRPRMSEVNPKITEETLARKMIFAEREHIKRIIANNSLAGKTAADA